MTARPVQAIFLWRYNVTAFAATYGRAPARGVPAGGSTGSYTKNFLQSPADQMAVLDRVLARRATGRVEFEFAWPSGSRPGHWQKSAVAGDERGQLFWDGNSNPPDPWKVGNPTTDAVCTIQGDPTKTTVPDANAEFARIEASGSKPVFVLVKLWGEEERLYPRVLLTTPPAALIGRGVATLPAALRKIIDPWLAGADSAFAHDFGAPHRPMRAPALVDRIIRTLKRDPNILLVGPPGTGKTVALEDLRSLFEAKEDPDVLFDPDVWNYAWSEGSLPAELGLLPADKERKVEPLVFHPSYGFEDFVAGLVPHVGGGTAGIQLDARPGPLLSLAHWSSSADRRALLIIDEFNRGPAASIFGDTLALLDGSKRSDSARGVVGASIRRPYLPSSMKVDDAYRDVSGGVVIGNVVRLPSTLWIAAAMNSADRSVAPLDAALRRRFSIIHVMPDYDAFAHHLGLPEMPASDPPELETGASEEDRLANTLALAVRLLVRMNERVGSVLGPDFLLGQALLWDIRRETSAEVLDALAAAFDERVAATLRLTFLDQDEILAAVLKVPQPSEAGTGSAGGPQASVAFWRYPPPSVAAIAPPRLELIEVSSLQDGEAKRRSLRSLL